MISFKEYLAEVELGDVDKKGGRYPLIQHLGKSLKTVAPHSIHLSHIDTEHSLHHTQWTADGRLAAKNPKSAEYHVVKNGKVVASIKTAHVGATEQTDTVEAHKSNTLPLHKVYAHLIKKHGKILQSSDLQSAGGKNLWHKLSKEPGIHVHGWDHKSRSQLILGIN